MKTLAKLLLGITLLLVPCLYLIIEDLRSRFSLGTDPALVSQKGMD